MKKLGAEVSKSHLNRINNGFYVKFMKGIGLDIGYKGYNNDIIPVLQTAIGIEQDYPNYDGLNLPFESNSQDYVFNSHVLEHISNYKDTIKEWFRVIKEDGHLVIIVPHKFLYEKKNELPSQWNGDHKRFYTPGSLLKEIEESLEPNSYRIAHLRDNDDYFDYKIKEDKHSGGCYEIELVVKKIKKPEWNLR